jgi:hypothetical protein
MRLWLPKPRWDWYGPVVTDLADDWPPNSEKIKAAYFGMPGFTGFKEARGRYRGGCSSSEEDDVLLESESESEVDSESEEVVFEHEVEQDEEDEPLSDFIGSGVMLLMPCLVAWPCAEYFESTHNLRLFLGALPDASTFRFVAGARRRKLRRR